MEKILPELQKKIQDERLQAMVNMARGITHDLNNALSPILGFSEMFIMRPAHLQDQEKVALALQNIHEAAKHAVEVVRRLREFYRPRDAREVVESVPLKSLAEKVLAVSLPQNSAITPKLNMPSDFCVAGNAIELSEVFSNLIQNAIDAMPDGGTLSISARSENQAAVVEVQDTGVGMSEEVLAKSMEPFFTTRVERGKGLGLSVALGIINRHHGKMDIQSRIGKGTSVFIRLPIEVKPAAARPAPAAIPAAIRPCHILAVDDDPNGRELLMSLLSSDGHTVETASNGREGLEKFHSGRFDVVITDKDMPEITGDKLAVVIKQFAPRKPVILLTAHGDELQASGARPQGVDAILSKPVTQNDLRRALSEIAI